MAKYDVPAVVSYTLSVTGKPSLHWVGHSQGTAQMFIALTTQPDLAPRIASFSALAPVAYLGHLSNVAIRALAALDEDNLLAMFGLKEFLPDAGVIKDDLPVFCGLFPYICENILFYIMGYDKGDTNTTRLDVYTSFDPAGTSTTNMVTIRKKMKKLKN